MRDLNAASWMQVETPELVQSCAGIQLLVLSVEGSLLNKSEVPDTREKSPWHFHLRDANALKKWKKAGGQIAIMTRQSGSFIRAKVNALHVDFFFENCQDKSTPLGWILRSQGLRPSRVATFASHGSDLFLAQQGSVIFAAPCAGAEFLRSAHFITRKCAGEGAVAEACELLMRTRRYEFLRRSR